MCFKPEKIAFPNVTDVSKVGWQMYWLECDTGLKDTSLEWRIAYVKR